jgi:hypothetical protein
MVCYACEKISRKGELPPNSRSVRYYCKRYGTFWGYTVAAGQGLKTGVKFLIKN